MDHQLVQSSLEDWTKEHVRILSSHYQQITQPEHIKTRVGRLQIHCPKGRAGSTPLGIKGNSSYRAF
jgi:hypothetical protein